MNAMTALKDLIPQLTKMMLLAALIMSLFPATVCVQVGFAVDNYLLQKPHPSAILGRVYRVLNRMILALSLAYLLLALVGIVIAARKVLFEPKPQSMTVPEGWQSAPQ